MPRPLILAHRGDWSNAAENSLGAFGAALRRPGVDGVEFDVRAARDGTPVVIHDTTLRRLHGVRRRVRDLSVVELGGLGAPALAEVLDALPAPFFLDIELKENIVARAVPIIAEHRGDPARDVVVSSFDLGTLLALRAIAPAWRTWLITRRLNRDVVRSAVAAGSAGIAARWPALKPAGARLARDAGLELATWTVNDQATLTRITATSVVAVCVDPGALP